MFNKLKAKLAEELDSETESNAEYAGYDRGAAGAAQGSPADQARALEAEVRDLKEHINKNYFIYVKRLEKRKERIKELEEYAKLVVRDNESLNEKLKEFEECQTQLGRARDNLDELEGFQSQELAKVKHMLLSAETALEKETRERKELGERVAKGESEAEKLRLEVSRKDAKLAEKENDLEARVALSSGLSQPALHFLVGPSHLFPAHPRPGVPARRAPSCGASAVLKEGESGE